MSLMKGAQTMFHAMRLRRPASLAGALAVLCALALCFALAAAAAAEEASPQAEAALSIDFSIQPSMMVAPGDVTMTFVLRNQTGRDVQNIYLSSADGMLSEPIGQIRARETQTLVRPHAVTQEELDAGVISYTISHDPAEKDGEKIVYTLSATIIKGEQQPSVSFTRQMSSRNIPKDGQVTITYKISNTGNVPLNTLRIRDALGDFTGRLEQLEVGDTKTFISRVTLEEDARSVPVLEYAVPSGEEYALHLEAADIGIADTELNTSFSVGQSAFIKDTATAVLILANGGDVDYSNITVVDDVYGGVIADSVNLPAGGKPVEISHTYPLRGEGEYRWRITGMNGAGQRLDRLTDTLTVPETRDEQTVKLALEAHTDTPKINRPGRVTFDFTVTNSGTATARDARLYEVERGDIRRLAVVPTGEPTRCSASYDVSADAEFTFCLNYADPQGRQHMVSFEPISVQIASDGVNPERTDDANAQLRGQSVKPGGSSSMFIVLLIIAGAALTVMVTILAVTSVRNRRERLRRMAAEKQRIKAELGKTGAFPPVKSSQRKRRAK